MNIRDAYNSKAIAVVHNEVASNKIPYLGAGFFPPKKKAGLDLKHIMTSKGLPVTLKASAFDTNSAIRSREGFKILETQMAFFKESMLIKEVDEQEFLRVEDANDPYARDVLNRVFNDAETLIDSADVVAERMRMQLLSTTGGNPSIAIASDGATYNYNYDPDNDYKTHNYLACVGDDAWSNHASSDPMSDIQSGLDAVEAVSGSRPRFAIMTRETFNHVKANAKVKSAILAQNVTANIFMTDERVKDLFASELGVDVLVYNKQYMGDDGNAKLFFPNGFCALVPEGALGSTWYGTTPDERTLLGNPNYDTVIVNTGVAVTVTTTSDPVQTKTTASEILLPSFERMMETYTIKAY